MSDSPPLAIKYLNGPEAGRLLLMSPPMRFGRHRDNEVCVSYDDRASRFHAEIRRAGDSHELVDLGSTRGTVVNGQPIEECIIQSSDQIAFGGVAALYVEDPPERRGHDTQLRRPRP